MFRGRRHIAATIDPDADSDEGEAMDIVPMDISDDEEEEGEECPVNPFVPGPDPIMAWKAQVWFIFRLPSPRVMSISRNHLPARAIHTDVRTSRPDSLAAEWIACKQVFTFVISSPVEAKAIARIAVTVAPLGKTEAKNQRQTERLCRS